MCSGGAHYRRHPSNLFRASIQTNYWTSRRPGQRTLKWGVATDARALAPSVSTRARALCRRPFARSINKSRVYVCVRARAHSVCYGMVVVVVVSVSVLLAKERTARGTRRERERARTPVWKIEEKFRDASVPLSQRRDGAKACM